MLFHSLISSDLTRMTDSERDQIDQDAQIFMRTCSEAIRQLRHEGASHARLVLTAGRQCNSLNAEINGLFIVIYFSFCPLSREAGDIGADKGAQGGGAGPQ